MVKGIAHFPVTILGALFLKVSAGGMCTEQIVYIAREAGSFILSETALKELGVLAEDFPVAGSFKGTTKVIMRQVDDASAPGPSATSAVSGVTKNVCGCPARTDVPPVPTTIPVEKPESNRSRLQKWILHYYQTSAFNVCLHQPIPAITGPDMEIVTIEGAEPVAIHSPIPTPHHWKEDVKKLLDMNCRLGVIELVSADMPVS